MKKEYQNYIIYIHPFETDWKMEIIYNQKQLLVQSYDQYEFSEEEVMSIGLSYIYEILGRKYER